MSVYVGLKQGKVHEKREMSEYYCGSCGWPVTDHDSYCRECGGAFQESFATERWNDTRWHDLFGTPEKAAEYFAMQCLGSDSSICCYCPFDDCDEMLRNSCSYPTVHNALLEWLKQEVDA